MKRIWLMIATILAASSLSLMPVSAESRTLSTSELAYISANCATIKDRINQLHVSDALMRVNRGQLYETMLSKLMLRFNKRVSNNNLDTAALTLSSDAFSAALDSFRSNYISYDDKLSQVLKIDCVSQPQAFYDGVDASRSLRQVVYGNIQSLNSDIDSYYAAFNGVKNTVETGK